MNKSGWIQPVYQSFDDSERRDSRRTGEKSSSRKESKHSRREQVPGGKKKGDDDVTTSDDGNTTSDEPTSSRTPPSTSANDEESGKQSKPTCTIHLAGSRYKKDIELTLDKTVDDLVYRILKCLDDECVDISGLRLKGKKNLMIQLQQWLAPFSSCFSFKPPKRRCVCKCSKIRRICVNPGDPQKRKKKKRRKRKGLCTSRLTNCRRVLQCSRSCCRKDDVVLIEICPSQTTDTDVKYKKQKERGVGTETSPELEILLNGRSLRCVAKKTGMVCKCTKCCPKSQKKKQKKEEPAPPKRTTEEDYRESDMTYGSERSEATVKRRRSSGSRKKMSFERTYSVLVKSDYNPKWDSERESASYSDAPRVLSQKPARWRKKTYPPPLSSRSDPFNVFPALGVEKPVDIHKWKQSLQKSLVPQSNIHKKKKRSKLFLGSDYILELHETSESVEETLKSGNDKHKIVRIADYLRLHKVFERSDLSKMDLTTTNSAISASSEDKNVKTELNLTENTDNCDKEAVEPKISIDYSDTVLKNEFSLRNFFTKVSDVHECFPNDETKPHEGICPQTSTLVFKDFPPTRKSNNILSFLKNIHSERKLPKTDVEREGVVAPKKSFSRHIVSSIQKLRMYLKLSKKNRKRRFSPVALDKKRGMLNLSSLISDSL